MAHFEPIYLKTIVTIKGQNMPLSVQVIGI